MQDIVDVLLCFTMVVVIIAGVYTTISMTILIRKFLKLKSKSIEQDATIQQMEMEDKKQQIEYTNDLLNFIKLLVGQVAVLEFRKFKDSHNFEKLTKAIVSQVLDTVATRVHDGIVMDKINFDSAMLTKEFLEKYIIETSEIMIKDLLENELTEE